VIREQWMTWYINRTDYPSDSVKISGLRRILFHKTCLRRILCHKKIWPAAHFFHMKTFSYEKTKNSLLLNHCVVHLISSFLFCLSIRWWCKWFELLLNHCVVHLISSFLFCLSICRWCKWFELQFSVITTKQFVPNSHAESATEQTLGQIKPC